MWADISAVTTPAFVHIGLSGHSVDWPAMLASSLVDSVASSASQGWPEQSGAA